MRPLKSILVLLFASISFTADAQAQLQWIYVQTYNQFPSQMGTFINAMPDKAGGLYFTAVTEDTVCSFSNDLAQLSRINTNGNLSWCSDFFYDTPCRSQYTNSLYALNTQIYLAVSDSSGHILKVDSSGNVVSIADTTMGSVFFLLNPDKIGNVVSVVFPQATSSLISHDSTLNVRWTYSPTYTFFCDFKKILSDRNECRIAVFDYNDNTQAETRGIGLMKLDTNGTLIWDTFINPQLTPADADWCVDAEIDNNGNVYVLSEDNNQAGVYLHKVDGSGNVAASAEYVIPAPLVDPKDIELDTVHGLIYVTGRKTGTIVRLTYDFDLNPLDTAWVVTQANGKSAQKTNEYGYFYQWWVMQNAGIKELHLDMYNHSGQLVDSYTYWDSTRFQNLYPEKIVLDSLGNIFGICSADDTAGNDAVVIFKFVNPLGASDELLHAASMEVYPNPATSEIHIQLNEPGNNSKLNITNSVGQTIMTKSFSGNTIDFSLENLSSGLYFIEVVTDSGLHSTQKLIIQQP